MRFSEYFGSTLRDDPSEADTASARLLLRAAYIRPLAAGIFSFLPLGLRVKTKIERILRAEMESIGGQEVLMPVVHPAEIWKRTGRWQRIGAEMGRLRDRAGRDLVLAMTHEEVVAALAASEIRSYRDLPRLIYHIQTKWRDDPRPRAGLIRVREFTMLDSYSLDASPSGMETQYQAHAEAYRRIFRRCGLPVEAVESDAGMMGGKAAQEFMYLTPIGEDTLLICSACGYRANRQAARFRKPAAAAEELRPIERVATPEVTSIEELAAFLHLPATRMAKAVFHMATLMEGDERREQFVFSVIRGDLEVNETKLANAIGALDLRPAREEEIRAAGAVPGYASPIGVHGVRIIADDSIPSSPNLVAGANQEGFHLRNVNYGRDYQAEVVVDIAAAGEAAGCPSCGAPLGIRRGVEVGNIFQLGTRYSEPMECRYLDREGKTQPVWMGSYGIGVGRLMACIAEEHHDEFGLIWPISVAPFHVALIAMGRKEEAEEIYRMLQAAGIEVFYDDRNERPGVMFADADLMGFPLRLTVSDRSLKQGGVEFKRRDFPEKRILPRETVVTEIRKTMDELFGGISVPEPHAAP
jgi:prolyl-tRNA synthetase